MVAEIAFISSLAIVHIFAGKLRFLDGVPRSRWLSIAGGVSVAYVFLHIFPELDEAQAHSEEDELAVLKYVEHHIYLIALLGLVVFYGIEAGVSRIHDKTVDPNSQGPESESPNQGIFWLHMASFSLYNALVGYLLAAGREREAVGLLTYYIAMALHFIVNDFGLRERHRRTYDRIGRWVLAAAAIAGWLIGMVAELGESAVHMFFAFLAGGIVLNVMKEELPEKRKSRFSAFGLGAAAYAVLLLFL
ncbi:hypothetical protein [Pelagicoccus sp. SDUM812002]|uniref:hypothetical protein n=1 Tax=Pelagicoccus sp. SDUM812002 TaxID=3041266 RepID=UPI00281062EC|nr:hypothetical protein [Pelagicoccus sp. SDUM812002]MDQ8186155.1 hypothetical protein [Pelagicoccus sp. SDUM812002]